MPTPASSPDFEGFPELPLGLVYESLSESSAVNGPRVTVVDKQSGFRASVSVVLLLAVPEDILEHPARSLLSYRERMPPNYITINFTMVPQD